MIDEALDELLRSWLSAVAQEERRRRRHIWVRFIVKAVLAALVTWIVTYPGWLPDEET